MSFSLRVNQDSSLLARTFGARWFICGLDELEGGLLSLMDFDMPSATCSQSKASGRPLALRFEHDSWVKEDLYAETRRPEVILENAIRMSSTDSGLGLSDLLTSLINHSVVRDNVK